MRKLVILFSTIFTIMITGCTLDKKDNIQPGTTNNTAETSEKSEDSVSKKELTSLIGTWECLDDMAKGDKVFIEQIGRDLIIQYAGEEAIKTEFSEKSSRNDSIYLRFENKKNEMSYMIDLKENGHIILNRGTTNTQKTGLSKPMEYKRIKNSIE